METIVILIDDDRDDQEIFQKELQKFNSSIKFFQLIMVKKVSKFFIKIPLIIFFSISTCL